MPGIGEGFRILGDFKELSLCGPCGPCFLKHHRIAVLHKIIKSYLNFTSLDCGIEGLIKVRVVCMSDME